MYAHRALCIYLKPSYIFTYIVPSNRMCVCVYIVFISVFVTIVSSVHQSFTYVCIRRCLVECVSKKGTDCDLRYLNRIYKFLLLYC